MEFINVALCTWDVGWEGASAEDFASRVIQHVQDSWAQGADVVLFPEFMWMGLERFVHEGDKLRGVAALYAGMEARLHAELSHPDKAVILGTSPQLAPDGTLRNRATIISEGRRLHQDKLNLTPWEKAFAAGEALSIWTFKGWKLAVIICLDIEVPELSVALRGRGVDAVLVPSATETVLGVERVGRCASARAVELGCYVGVAHLVGQAVSELVDENVGRLSWAYPSQNAFKQNPREDHSELFEAGFHAKTATLSRQLLQRMRKNTVETNPAHLTPPAVTTNC